MENMLNAIEIGMRIRKLRGIRTQKGLAEALGISQNSLGNYEKGRRIPPDDVKVRMASYFGVDIKDLFYTP